jgi:acyl-CoA synthetase (AMP-forming)/AMP-acid ligase II/acyl carrier protein
MNIAETLWHRANISEKKNVYTFLDGESRVQQLTYGQLHEAASRLGAHLQQLVDSQDRVILLYPPGLSYIIALFACFYTKTIAIPAYPPGSGRNNHKLKRLERILLDANPKVALCSGPVLATAQKLFDTMPALKNLRWIDTDKIGAEAGSMAQLPEFETDTVAFLQYTSGSTGDPKGVKVSHENLNHNLKTICDAFGHTEESRGVIWLPPYHDMGLIGGILQPLFAGFPVTLMPPTSFLQKPFAWLKAISDGRGTISGGPNSAYDLCVQRVTDTQKQSLNLSSWEVAFNGSEPVRRETIRAFAGAFANCGFREKAFLPCYGLAEATLMVTGFRDSAHCPQVVHCRKEGLEKGFVDLTQDPSDKTLVASGAPASATDVQIVDPETEAPADAGKIGEIWVSSPSVAAGYWEKVEESKASFEKRLRSGENSRTYLRTGDLGFLHRGNLYVTGRLKDLIIIRGINYYPQDIEATAAQSHESLRSAPGAAFSVESDTGHECLVLVHEVGRHWRNENIQQIISSIRTAVAREHELPVQFVVLLSPGQLPKTSSGKIQRSLCRKLFLSNGFAPIALHEWNAPDTSADKPDPSGIISLNDGEWPQKLEGYLRSTLAQIFKQDPGAFSGAVNLYETGFDSLMLVDFQHRLERDLGVSISYSALMEMQDLKQLVSEVSRQILHEAPTQIHSRTAV